jgi:cell division protein FtsA
MQEHQQAAVGIDIGTTTIRCAIGLVKTEDQSVSLVGIGEAPNTGFRKGSVVNISETATALDQAIAHAERMAGMQVSSATVNINGSHIKGVDSKGIIAVSGSEITQEDLFRVEDAATVLQLPQHQEILSVFPRSYMLDGQANIKDPIGMSGTRLEVDAHVVTVSAPALKNIEKVVETTETHVNRLSVGSLGAAQSTLSRDQRENGVALLDIGASTTNLMVVEDSDVQLVSVIPIGGNNITNDLAIGLRTELKVAEAVKRNYKYLTVSGKTRPKHIKVVVAQKEHIFPTKDIELIITARLVELFQAVDKELAKVHRSKKIPGGVTIVGGAAHLPGIEVVAREELALSARVAFPTGIGGLKEKVARPEYATVVGLMLLDVHKEEADAYGGRGLGGRLQHGADQARSLFNKVFGRFGF